LTWPPLVSAHTPANARQQEPGIGAFLIAVTGQCDARSSSRY